ncbi:13665_t:CDS:1, partial [Gigaspora margarita]
VLSSSESSKVKSLRGFDLDDEVLIKIDGMVVFLDVVKKVFGEGVLAEFDEMEAETFWVSSIESLTICPAFMAVQESKVCSVH